MLHFIGRYDLILSSRNHRLFGRRTLYIALLVLEFVLLAWLLHWDTTASNISHRGMFLDAYVYLVISQHLLIILIGTPLLFSGVIAADLANGTLPLLMTTDLQPWEYLYGKCTSRFIQLLSLLIIAVPFLLLAAFYGYALPFKLVLALLIISLCLVFGLGAWSLWLSLQHTQPRQAIQAMIIRVLLLGSSWFIVSYMLLPELSAIRSRSAIIDGISGFFEWVLPIFNLFASYQASLNGNTELMMQHAYWLCLGSTCLGIWFLIRSSVSLRALTASALENRERSSKNLPRLRFLRPSIDEDDPIAWRERFLQSGWGRWFMTASMLIASWLVSEQLLKLLNPWYFFMWWLAGGFVICLFVVIRASGCISGERLRQTWESLLLTPLDTWEILFDKRRGVIRAFAPTYYALSVPTLFYAYGLSIETFVISLSLLAFIWGIMYFFASIGIYNSVVNGSWLSLLSSMSLGIGYSMGIFIILVSLALIGMLCIFIPAFLFIMRWLGMSLFSDHYWNVALFVIFSLMAWRMYHQGNIRLWLAQAWIDQEERYGRTLTRSLSQALRSHYRRLENKKSDQEKPHRSSLPT